MCRPEDYEHLIPATQEDPPSEPPVERRSAPRNPVLAAADALGLPDCSPDCTCRGRSAEES